MRLLVLVASLTVVVAAPAFAADPVEGEWLAPDKGGKIRIAPCPAKADRMCGTTTWIKGPPNPLDVKNPDPAARTKSRIGQQMLRDLKQTAPGRWTGGKIYDPTSGKTYDSKLTANANGTLKLEGCVAMVCQAQIWTRD